MRVTSIIENTSVSGLPVEHGLSLYIQLANGMNVLFDLGQSNLFAENASHLGLSIADVDLAVISHGHYDHGGGLASFLALNSKAEIYLNKGAFEPHYSLRDSGLTYIGLDKNLAKNGRIHLCTGIYNDFSHVSYPDCSSNSPEVRMTLFADVKGRCCFPVGNRLLFGPENGVNDDFCHEQNLLIREGENLVLFAGCAHNGIVNIVRKAIEISGQIPTYVFAGMHLVKSGLSTSEENLFINNLANELKRFVGCKFFTMHCTGVEQYNKLKTFLGEQINYLSCGESINI